MLFNKNNLNKLEQILLNKILHNQSMNFINTPKTKISLDIIRKIMLYIENCNQLDIQSYLQNGDNVNINFKINEFIHLLNEIWTDFIPTIEILDYETTKEFVYYIFNNTHFSIIDIIKYSINRLDEIIMETNSRTFYTISDYYDFIFINQPFYDNIFIEILDDICNYHHSYANIVPPVYQNLLFMYQSKNNTLNNTLYKILITLNQSTENLTYDLANLNL